ncbi:MAG: NUDIX hydrolase [Actinomycetota bacterium]
MNPERPHIAVGAVVVKDGALLMVRRARAPAQGLWSLPGGRLENNELLTDCVAREVAEETGLEVQVGDLLGIFEVPGDPHYVILDFVAVPSGDTEPVAGTDATEARWVPLEEVAHLPCTPRFVETMKAWKVLP